jgi:hypothetical protein
MHRVFFGKIRGFSRTLVILTLRCTEPYVKGMVLSYRPCTSVSNWLIERQLSVDNGHERMEEKPWDLTTRYTSTA